ncbi:MAG: transcriptional regulator NrdR [Dehalococcoidia bacterium]|nr:transcriptional regulator NrdR [Dehalococcoidia bacterium]
MKCPYCSDPESKVIDSRDVDDAVRRRRECLRCGIRFTTYERVEFAGLQVVKKDGRREDFDRRKLAIGIRKACEKRPLPVGAVDKVVDDVETELHKLGKAEVPSNLIGERIMEYLRQLDDIAYIRFASAYRPFQDINSLREELDALASHRERGNLADIQLPLFPADNSDAALPIRRTRRD